MIFAGATMRALHRRRLTLVVLAAIFGGLYLIKLAKTPGNYTKRMNLVWLEPNGNKHNGCQTTGKGSIKKDNFVFSECEYTEPQSACAENSMQKVASTNIIIYSAYLNNGLSGNIQIMVLGWSSSLKPDPFYCILTYEDGSVVSVKGKWDRLYAPRDHVTVKYFPQTFFCPEPNGKKPVRVSFSSTSCGTLSNSLTVLDRSGYRPQAPGGVAICLGHLSGIFSVQRLAEWVEMQKIFNVDKIILYGATNLDIKVHDLLKHYVSDGLVHLQEFPLGDKATALQSADLYKNGIWVTNNDCLYRFGKTYKYLLFIDTEDFIVQNPSLPSRYEDIFNYIGQQKKNNTVGHVIKRQHFCSETDQFSDTRDYLVTQKITRYSERKLRPKSFINPAGVFIMGEFYIETKRAEHLRSTKVSSKMLKINSYKQPQAFPDSDPVQYPCSNDENRLGRLIPKLRAQVDQVLMTDSPEQN